MYITCKIMMDAQLDFVMICDCGNDTFLDYRYPLLQGRFFGKVCQKCWREMLTYDAMNTFDDRARPPTPRLFSRQMSLPEFKRAFPVTPARKEVKEDEVRDLMPGDHIMWHRPYVLWHHAIIIEAPNPYAYHFTNGGANQGGIEGINQGANGDGDQGAIGGANKGAIGGANQGGFEGTNQGANGDGDQGANATGNGVNTTLKVLHWSKDKDSIRIQEKEIEYSKELGRLYKVTYDDVILRRNPPELVLARAYALQGSTDYKFFTKNCENYAVFCKTGVNFNHQFPWLMLKLDETVTGTLVRLLKMVGLLPIVSTIIFSEGIEFYWKLSEELIGASMVLLLESISLINDLGNMYFEFKYPASCCKLRREDFKLSIIMRTFEFVFGTTGMVLGALAAEQLCIFCGEKICPGLGSLVGLAVGAMVFGTIFGFLLGTIGKAVGNVVGICIGRRSVCCRETEQTDQASDTTDPGTPGAESVGPLLFDTDRPSDSGDEDDERRRKMRKIYRPSSWEAQLGFVAIIFSCVLLYAFAKHYIGTYRDFRDSVQATCITAENATDLSMKYPCAAVEVYVIDNQLNVNISEISQSDFGSSIFASEGNTSQLFENENYLKKGNCSIRPECETNNTFTRKKVAKFVKKYGFKGANFTCYYQFNNRSNVIRELTSVPFFVNMFFWPSLLCVSGLSLIIHAIVRLKRKDENCFTTLITVLGFRSYFDLLERCKCCSQ